MVNDVKLSGNDLKTSLSKVFPVQVTAAYPDSSYMMTAAVSG